MEILTCPNCAARLRPEEANVIKVRPAGTHYHERTNCCPHCHTVLSVEVTMAEGDVHELPSLTEFAV
jgi:uncharacterized protein YbaR (Trm112 family)